MEAKRFSDTKLLSYRGLVYILLTAFVSVFHNLLFPLEELGVSSHVFMVFLFVCILQFVFAFKVFAEEQFFILFLADASAAMLLVRESGGSASPFTLLFPLISLSAAAVFRNRLWAWILAGSAVVFMSLSVGFGPAIIGNALAIAGTSLLGQYLSTTIKKTGKALELSEGARRRLENIQRAILQNIPSGLMSVDTFGKVIQVNSVGANILGYSENEMLGMYLRELMPELDSIRDKLHTMHPVINTLNKANSRKVVNAKAKDQSPLKLGYSLARLNDPEDRSPLGTLVVFQDLTHIIRIEEELRMSEKLAAVGKLAAGIAHEIRNPLAGISGSAQMLSGLKNLDEEDARLLAIIQRESARVDELISEFLNYVRPSDLKLEKLDLNKIAKEVVEALKFNPLWKQSHSRLDLVEAVQSLRGEVMGDRNKLTQVLMNLIINAGQAHAKNVTVKIVDEKTIEVIDDGVGVPPENQSRIFEPFFTTKDKGTGLGLALSYKLIEAMGGGVMLKSPLPELVPQGGTKFTIELRGANEDDEHAAV